MKKKPLYLLLLPAAIALSACSGSNTASGSDSAATAESQADIEAATIQGRNVAREFINRDWKDTLELQTLLLEIQVKHRDKYILDKHPAQAEAFDSAFIQTIRTVRPSLADEIASLPDDTDK
jgi:hypothetical protein